MLQGQMAGAVGCLLSMEGGPGELADVIFDVAVESLQPRQVELVTTPDLDPGWRRRRRLRRC